MLHQSGPRHAHIVGDGPGPRRGTRLLLLEDDAALRHMLGWELADLGYDVEPVGSCPEARAAVSGSCFTYAILDVGLPDGDGISLAAELVTAYPPIHILLCSGRHGAFDRRAIPKAVLACLTKPISSKRLDELLLTQP